MRLNKILRGDVILLMETELKNVLTELEPKMVEIRREIHRNPELGFEEEETAALIGETLAEQGIEAETGIAKTGLVALVGEENSEGPVVGIRADMDALSLSEHCTTDYCSREKDKMHACGHDGHVAIALGTALAADRLSEYLPGQIKFIFQPAEEGPGGAEPMISEGVLQDPDVDCLLALHIWDKAEAGEIEIKKGPTFAAIDEFDLELRGASAHGACPHHGRDTIVIASEIIQKLQSLVSREVNPAAGSVISIGKILGGDRRNILAGSVEMEATVRALSEEVRDFLERRIEEVISGTCALNNIDYDLEYRRLYPPLINDKELAELVRLEAEKVDDIEEVRVAEQPTMGGEDFAYFARELPAFMFWLGGQNPEEGITAPLHNPDFDFDESIMKPGAEVFLRSVRRLMMDWQE